MLRSRNIECFIENGIHKPAAIGAYHVWNQSLRGVYQNTYYKFEGGGCVSDFLEHLKTMVFELYDNESEFKI